MTDMINNEEQRQTDLHTVQHRIHGHDFFKQCRLPLYWLARLRAMKVGETFIMGSIRHFYDELGFQGISEIYAQKASKGVYHLHSNWTLPTKPTRPHRFSSLTLKIEKGGTFAFTHRYSLDNLRSFKLTARYIQRITRYANEEEKAVYKQHGLPYFLSGVNVDKNNITSRAYPVQNGSEVSLGRIQFTDEQMPKPMMECLIEAAAAMGVFGSDEDHSFNYSA